MATETVQSVKMDALIERVDNFQKSFFWFMGIFSGVTMAMVGLSIKLLLEHAEGMHPKTEARLESHEVKLTNLGNRVGRIEDKQ